MKRALGLSLLLFGLAACSPAASPSGASATVTGTPATSAEPEITAPASISAGEAYRGALAAALAEFEPPWYLDCFGFDDGGNMPKVSRGATGTERAVAKLAALRPPDGWLAVDNAVDDLLALVESVHLNAAGIRVGYEQYGGYEDSNASWQEKVLAPCAASTALIRSIREQADAIR